jgi:alpha-glucuronidase
MKRLLLNSKIEDIKKMMMGSWEACVDYMTPLGLHHIMAANNHYGPQPGYISPVRNDWSSTYYHRADANGIGFDRSSKGSNAVSQYHSPLSKLWDSPKTCSENICCGFIIYHGIIVWSPARHCGKVAGERHACRKTPGPKSYT